MMINWKLRLQNKCTLTAIVLSVIAIAYNVASACGYALPVEQSVVIDIAESIIGVLVLIGVIVDPTTSGLSDSEQAMQYEEPKE